jgi:methyl-accepting chemotaxis protein
MTGDPDNATDASAALPEDAQAIRDLSADYARFALVISRFLVVIAIVLMGGFSALWIPMGHGFQLASVYVVLIPMLIGALVYPALYRRGHIVWAMRGLVIPFVLMGLYLPILLPGILVQAAIVVVIGILLATFLLSNAAGRSVTLVTVPVFSGVVGLLRWWTPPWSQPMSAGVEAIILGVLTFIILILTVLTIRLVLYGQRAQLARIQAANREIAQRITVEQAQRAELESANGEIMVRIQREQEHLARLELIIGQAQQVAEQLRSAAAEILAATTQQSASATQQESAAEETLVTVEEVRATVSQTAERAGRVAQAARESVDVSQEGQSAVSDSIAGMTRIRQQVDDIATTILQLSERTQQIGEIIASVNAIADQSKLLALNASIEAARAGTEGRGFAVVAMEIRQLAEQSRQATARIQDILHEIQQATNTAVMVTEAGTKGTDTGVTLVQDAGLAIADLTATIEQAAQAAAQIAASTHQQTNGMDQLVNAISAIRQATIQTTASTRQAEQSALDLHELAHALESVVQQPQMA